MVTTLGQLGVTHPAVHAQLATRQDPRECLPSRPKCRVRRRVRVRAGLGRAGHGRQRRVNAPHGLWLTGQGRRFVFSWLTSRPLARGWLVRG
jgi:hypothetical protein